MKKRNKILALTLALCALLVLASACGTGAADAADLSQTPPVDAVADASTDGEPVENTETPKTDGENMGAEEPQPIEMGETYFGKVKSIVGNEIEIELAKPPFEAPEGGGEGGEGSGGAFVEHSVTIHKDDEGIAEVRDGDTGAQIDAAGAVFAVDGGDGNVQYFGGVGEGEKMELEYTGETKSFTVPAGADIVSMIGGEAKLDAIKKGSVVMVTAPKDEANGTVSSIMIME